MSLSALPRLAIVLSHPTQYYSPWFRALRADSQIEFRVFYLWDFGVVPRHDPQFARTFAWDVDLLEGYEHEFVANRSRRPGTDHFFGLRNPAATTRLAAWKPEAILLFGYNYATHLWIIAWARPRGIPLVFRGDSHLLGGRALSAIRRMSLKVIYRQFSVLTYVGQANRDYFRAIGVPDALLCFAPHAVDHEHFDPTLRKHQARGAELRTALGLEPSTRVVLFAGKFIRAKQPRALLQAFIDAAIPQTALVFVGAGEEQPALESLAQTASPGTVHFKPFANQSEMPAVHLLADVFALPSIGLFETWGLAVNEAMHMGVPALLSDRVGCHRDLVTPGVTGWVFAADDAAGLRRTLALALTAVKDPRQRDRLRTAVQARVAQYTYAQTTAGLLSALELATDGLRR